MISKELIEQAKTETKYTDEVFHEHDDCIRIAFEWLDAQTKTKHPNMRLPFFPMKHFIERWAGRYVSQTDVDVAAQLHQAIRGSYPNFNISRAIILPSKDRLKSIEEAFTQGYWIRKYDMEVYKKKEIYRR